MSADLQVCIYGINIILLPRFFFANDTVKPLIHADDAKLKKNNDILQVVKDFKSALTRLQCL